MSRICGKVNWDEIAQYKINVICMGKRCVRKLRRVVTATSPATPAASPQMVESPDLGQTEDPEEGAATPPSSPSVSAPQGMDMPCFLQWMQEKAAQRREDEWISGCVGKKSQCAARKSGCAARKTHDVSRHCL